MSNGLEFSRPDNATEAACLCLDCVRLVQESLHQDDCADVAADAIRMLGAMLDQAQPILGDPKRWRAHCESLPSMCGQFAASHHELAFQLSHDIYMAVCSAVEPETPEQALRRIDDMLSGDAGPFRLDCAKIAQRWPLARLDLLHDPGIRFDPRELSALVRIEGVLSDREVATTNADHPADPPNAPDQTANGSLDAVPRGGGHGPVYLGNGKLDLGPETISLEDNEQDVLECLLDHDGAATLGDLRRSKGEISNPNRVLSSLLHKYKGLAGHITMPGGRGRGGYRTTIQDGRQSETI